MEIVVKLNNQTAGKDRLIRLLQYSCRTYWYYTQNAHRTKYSVEILRNLEFTFSSFRRLLRLGQCLDSLHQALKMMRYPNLMVRITLTLAKLANALYLLADHLIWIGRMGLLKVDLEKWNGVANKYWLVSIIMNLTRDICEIVKILGHESLLKRLAKHSIFDRRRVLSYLRDNKEVVMDTVKNGCDLFIPLTALGYTKFTPGTIGLLGVISSLIGLYMIIDPYSKLSP